MNVIKQMDDLGITAEMLDDVVHDAANTLAANANNGGLRGQVNFLLIICGQTADEIVNAAKLELPNRSQSPELDPEPLQDDEEM